MQQLFLPCEKKQYVTVDDPECHENTKNSLIRNSHPFGSVPSNFGTSIFMERNRGELSVQLTRVVDGVGKAVDDVGTVVEDDGVDARGRDETLIELLI